MSLQTMRRSTNQPTKVLNTITDSAVDITIPLVTELVHNQTLCTILTAINDVMLRVAEWATMYNPCHQTILSQPARVKICLTFTGRENNKKWCLEIQEA